MNWLIGPLAGPLVFIANTLSAGLDVLVAINRNLTSIKENTAAMNMNFETLNAGVAVLNTGMDAIATGIQEVSSEVATLKGQVGDNSQAQATIDSIGTRLTEIGQRAQQFGDTLRNLVPDETVPTGEGGGGTDTTGTPVPPVVPPVNTPVDPVTGQPITFPPQ